MIKLPIKLLTPPVRLNRLPGKTPKNPGKIAAPNPAKPAPGGTQSPAKPSKPVSGGKPHGQGGAPAPVIPSFESLFRKMLERYVPETVEFRPVSEDVLRDTISNWLRPAYEQAIQSRRERTERINAELDADAWSRGMGESTYLTDVKERQLRGEAQDVDTIESNYAATLAGELYNAIKSQQEQKIEVDRFNAEQINAAHRHAAEAAEALYQTYLNAAAAKTGGSSGSGGTAGKTTGGSGADWSDAFDVKTYLEGRIGKADYRTVVNLLSRMTSDERRQLYDRGNASYAKLRAEILNGIGAKKYAELMTQYPA